jgi:multidrug transporter EmrE-like cation transporter
MPSTSFALPSIGGILIFFVALALQVVGASLLPRTAGFTSPGATIVCILAYVVSVALVAVLIQRGMALAIIVPLFSAGVPLATIAVAYSVNGEPISLGKLAFLLLACGRSGSYAVKSSCWVGGGT